MVKKARVPWQKIIFLAVFITLFCSLITIGIAMWSAPTAPTEGHARIKSDYVLKFLQCLLGSTAMFLSSWLSHKWELKIPPRLSILYAVFLYFSIFLGEVRGFYFLIPQWDTLLHVFSGLALSAFGFSVFGLLYKNNGKAFLNSPMVVALFAFCFAVTLGVVWEIYEFFADAVFATNMQKHSSGDGMSLVGKAALADTMEDLIADTAGAFFVSLVGYISLKFKKGWIEKMFLIRQS